MTAAPASPTEPTRQLQILVGCLPARYLIEGMRKTLPGGEESFYYRITARAQEPTRIRWCVAGSIQTMTPNAMENNHV